MNVKAKLVTAHDLMQKMQLELHGLLSSMPREATTMSVPDAVDSGFLCREVAKICDDLRKALNVSQQIVARTLALKAAAESMQGKHLELRGELATASPSAVTKPKLPDRGTDEWNKLMRHLGCTEDQLEADFLRPSWRQIQELLEQLAVEGKESTLPGVTVAHTDVTVHFRTKARKTKGVTNDEF